MREVAKYWVIYYLVYIATVVFLLVRHWNDLRWDDVSYVFLLAAIVSLGAGTALIVAIIVEVTGFMVLLIPDRIRKLKEAGRVEGRVEGRETERQEWRAWYERQQAALRDGKPFDEPPPDEPPGKNGK